jgi:hypothetical protein
MHLSWDPEIRDTCKHIVYDNKIPRDIERLNMTKIEQILQLSVLFWESAKNIRHCNILENIQSCCIAYGQYRQIIMHYSFNITRLLLHLLLFIALYSLHFFFDRRLTCECAAYACSNI